MPTLVQYDVGALVCQRNEVLGRKHIHARTVRLLDLLNAFAFTRGEYGLSYIFMRQIEPSLHRVLPQPNKH